VRNVLNEEVETEKLEEGGKEERTVFLRL